MKEMDVVSAWPHLMGVAVANRTKEIRIQNKKLFLTIDSSVMREELLLGKQIIIDRINEYAGQQIINDVWFS
jgi:predicted nucleic acid-binding Zn ribbon protein